MGDTVNADVCTYHICLSMYFVQLGAITKRISNDKLYATFVNIWIQLRLIETKWAITES